MNDGPLNLNFSGVAWQNQSSSQPTCSLAQARCGPRQSARELLRTASCATPPSKHSFAGQLVIPNHFTHNDSASLPLRLGRIRGQICQKLPCQTQFWYVLPALHKHAASSLV